LCEFLRSAPSVTSKAAVAASAGRSASSNRLSLLSSVEEASFLLLQFIHDLSYADVIRLRVAQAHHRRAGVDQFAEFLSMGVSLDKCLSSSSTTSVPSDNSSRSSKRAHGGAFVREIRRNDPSIPTVSLHAAENPSDQFTCQAHFLHEMAGCVPYPDTLRVGHSLRPSACVLCNRDGTAGMRARPVHPTRREIRSFRKCLRPAIPAPAEPPADSRRGGSSSSSGGGDRDKGRRQASSSGAAPRLRAGKATASAVTAAARAVVDRAE
jgi:hypothetical protein